MLIVESIEYSFYSISFVLAAAAAEPPINRFSIFNGMELSALEINVKFSSVLPHKLMQICGMNVK